MSNHLTGKKEKNAIDISGSLSGFPKRFEKAVIKTVGKVNASAFSRKSGISDSLVRKYLNGDSEPGLSKLLTVAEAADVPVGWLASGEGSMRRGEAPQQQSGDGAVPVVSSGVQEMTLPRLGKDTGHRRGNELVEVTLGADEVKGAHFVPYFDAPVGAGYGGNADLIQPQGYMAFRADWLRRELRIRPERAFVAEVFGISMKGLLDSGDLVIGEFAEEIPRQDLCVVAYDGDLLVKHLQRRDDGLTLRSENHLYDDIVVQPGLTFYFIGCVRGHVRRI